VCVRVCHACVQVYVRVMRKSIFFYRFVPLLIAFKYVQAFLCRFICTDPIPTCSVHIASLPGTDAVSCSILRITASQHITTPRGARASSVPSRAVYSANTGEGDRLNGSYIPEMMQGLSQRQHDDISWNQVRSGHSHAPQNAERDTRSLPSTTFVGKTTDNGPPGSDHRVRYGPPAPPLSDGSRTDTARRLDDSFGSNAGHRAQDDSSPAGRPALSTSVQNRNNRAPITPRRNGTQPLTPRSSSGGMLTPRGRSGMNGGR